MAEPERCALGTGGANRGDLVQVGEVFTQVAGVTVATGDPKLVQTRQSPPGQRGQGGLVECVEPGGGLGGVQPNRGQRCVLLGGVANRVAQIFQDHAEYPVHRCRGPQFGHRDFLPVQVGKDPGAR